MLSKSVFLTSVLKIRQKYIFSSRVGPGSTSLSIMTGGFTSFSIELRGGVTDSVFPTFVSTT